MKKGDASMNAKLKTTENATNFERGLLMVKNSLMWWWSWSRYAGSRRRVITSVAKMPMSVPNPKRSAKPVMLFSGNCLRK